MEEIFTHLNPQVSSLALPVWIDIAAVVVGATFGALTANERKLDLLGAIGLGFCCGLGGGLIRDMIMQSHNVYILRSPYVILASILASTLVFFFTGLFRGRRMDRVTAFFDILAVALFAASGTDKAIVYGLSILPALFMGLLTGVGGGMLRDTFLGDVPQIFRPGNLYALCAVAGSLAYWVLAYAGFVKTVACLGCVVVVVGLRWVSVHFNIVTPHDIDLSPKLVSYMKRRRHTTGSAAYTPQLSNNERAVAYREALKEEIRREIREEMAAEKAERESSQATGSAEAIFTPESEQEPPLDDDSRATGKN